LIWFDADAIFCAAPGVPLTWITSGWTWHAAATSRRSAAMGYRADAMPTWSWSRTG